MDIEKNIKLHNKIEKNMKQTIPKYTTILNRRD